MKDNQENEINLRHKHDRIYLRNILYIQYFQLSLHNDHNDLMSLFCSKRMRPSGLNLLRSSDAYMRR